MSVTRTTRVLLAGAAIALAGTALAVAAPATAAPHRAAATPVTKGSYYLALGDSVPFGFREPSNLPTPDYSKASNFQGYPEIVGQQLGLKVANAACPGETSSSLLNTKAQSNGCLKEADGTSPGYRGMGFPLHEKYSTSQLAYAVKFLKAHRNTRLVTLMIGANDGFICQASTKDRCQSEIGPVIAKIEKNVTTMMKAIRTTAHYTGQIVIVNYYSNDYTNTDAGKAQMLGARAINVGLDQGARPDGKGNPYHVTIAKTYLAFKAAAAQTKGNDCTAGLLTILHGASTPCGVHPSVAGQNLIAGTVVSAIQK